jgi:hypothetical protein
MRGSSPRTTPAVWRAFLYAIQFPNSKFSQRFAAPILCGAGYAVVCLLPPPSESTEGARDAKGPEGPAGLDASRHRGLSKPVVPQVRQVRWRPARGVYRFAPHGPRWTDLSGVLPYRRGHLSTAVSPNAGPVARGWRAGTTCGLDRRALAPHLRCKVIPRPPLPAPRLKMLYRHPSVRGGMHAR